MPDIDIDFSVRGRERVIRYVTDKYGKESVAQIVTFGKMFPRAATRDAARVLGHDYGAGDRLAKLIPDPIMGRPPSFEDCLAAGQPLRAEVDRDADRQADRRRRAGPRGDRPQLLDPRRRGGDRGPAADRHRAAPDRRRRLGRERRAGVPHGHAVLDEADRGDRPAQDGLPRPAQPRRDRGRAGHHRALDRRAAGHGGAAARPCRRPTRCWRAATRSACSSSSPRACARRSRRSARRVRRPRRAQRAVPPGRDGPDPDLRPRQARPRVDHLPRRAAAADPRVDQGRDPLPGAGDADRQGAGRLQRRQGRRPAQGDRQEEPRGDGQAQARVRRGLPAHPGPASR